MTVQLINGDARHIPLADNTVQCCVTSPPYWGLRDYGTATWEGGSADCDHSPANTPTRRGLASSTLAGGKETTGHQQEGYRDVCPKCGALRVDNQIGLEQTPDEYIANLVAVFREVRRVLRPDGTCWLNLGDSYAANRGYQVPDSKWGDVGNNHGMTVPDGLKPKDLCGIPWRVAFALQADGWYLRSDIIWHKPNPMPESVTDRPTKSHEYLFLLAKSERYYYDAEAIAEPAINTKMPGHNMTDTRLTYGPQNGGNSGLRDLKQRYHNGDAPSTRNRRSVWTVATQPYSGAHFATFPKALIEPCILAGTSAKGACPECGAPWERVVERGESTYARIIREQGITHEDMHQKARERGVNLKGGVEGWGGTRNANGTTPHLDSAERTTTGWQPTCACGRAGTVPCVVLDPFAGSGTTLAVAAEHNRSAYGIELNPEYMELAIERLYVTPRLMLDAA